MLVLWTATGKCKSQLSSPFIICYINTKFCLMNLLSGWDSLFVWDKWIQFLQMYIKGFYNNIAIYNYIHHHNTNLLINYITWNIIIASCLSSCNSDLTTIIVHLFCTSVSFNMCHWIQAQTAIFLFPGCQESSIYSPYVMSEHWTILHMLFFNIYVAYM